MNEAPKLRSGPPRVVLLISGTGSNAMRLIDDMHSDGYANPVAVISNRPEAPGLEKARSRGVATEVVDHRGYGPGREGFEQAMAERLRFYRPDWIVLAGFMRILSEDFVQAFAGKMVNIHPSLLPKFKGTDTHARALAAGEAEHGASVHIVTPSLDDGPVLGQARLRVKPTDDAASLQARVLKLEHQLYPAVLRHLVAGKAGLVEIDARD